MDTFRIANHLLTIEGDRERQHLLSMPGLSLFGEIAANKEWLVRYGCLLSASSVGEGRDVLYEFDLADGQIRCQFYSVGEKYYLTQQLVEENQCALTLSYSRGSKVVEVTTTDNATMLHFSLWFAFALLSASSRTSLLHASTVVWGGDAILFLGESGTGKSTHAQLWLQNISGARLLNDDSPAIAVEDERLMVYGSPWSGKTDCYYNQCYPVKAIVRLSQAPRNSIRLLSPVEATVAILPSLPPALMHDGYFSDILVAMASDMLKRVPVYQLDCLPDSDAVQLCHSTIFNVQ